MNILIDGPDGTGKSTLCNELIMRGYQYIHSNKPEDATKYFNAVAHIMSNHNSVVLDRGPISNIVYSNVFDGGMGVADDDVLKKLMQNIDVIVISLPEDKDRYMNDFNNLKEGRVELYDNMSSIYDEYKSQSLFKDLLVDKRVVYYDRYKVNKGEIKEFVEREILC